MRYARGLPIPRLSSSLEWLDRFDAEGANRVLMEAILVATEQSGAEFRPSHLTRRCIGGFTVARRAPTIKPFVIQDFLSLDRFIGAWDELRYHYGSKSHWRRNAARCPEAVFVARLAKVTTSRSFPSRRRPVISGGAPLYRSRRAPSSPRFSLRERPLTRDTHGPPSRGSCRPIRRTVLL